MSSSKVLIVPAYVLALVFLLVAMTSHPQAVDVFGRWFSWYLPVSGALAVPLGYTLYKLLAAIVE